MYRLIKKLNKLGKKIDKFNTLEKLNIFIILRIIQKKGRKGKR